MRASAASSSTRCACCPTPPRSLAPLSRASCCANSTRSACRRPPTSSLTATPRGCHSSPSPAACVPPRRPRGHSSRRAASCRPCSPRAGCASAATSSSAARALSSARSGAGAPPSSMPRCVGCCDSPKATPRRSSRGCTRSPPSASSSLPCSSPAGLAGGSRRTVPPTPRAPPERRLRRTRARGRGRRRAWRAASPRRSPCSPHRLR